MKPTTGLLLRLLGPLIEVVCIGLLFAFPDSGPPLRDFLYAGIGLGLAMVIAGLTLVKRVHPARQPPKEDL
jgi:hypothetical protein